MLHRTRRLILPVVLLGGLLAAAQVDFLASDAWAQRDQNRDEAARAGGSCEPFGVVGAPRNLVSGAWRGRELVVVDPGRRLLQVDFATGLARARPLGAAINGALSRLSPLRIRSRPEAPSSPSAGYVLELAGGGEFMRLDRRFAYQDRVHLHQRFLPEATTRDVKAVWDWTVAGGDIVGYVDMEVFTPAERSVRPLDNWRTGFVRFPMSDPEAVRILYERPYPHRLRTFFRLTFPFIASVDGRAYAILMGDDIKLVRLDVLDENGEPLPLRSFRWRQKSPLLPDIVDPGTFPWIMQRVEVSSMPVGLYGWDGHLFVLSRTFARGTTSWSMTKIHPGTDRGGDRVIWHAAVGSSAPHLIAIPGPERWAFAEKASASVTDDGIVDQPTIALKLIDAGEMSSTARPRLCS